MTTNTRQIIGDRFEIEDLEQDLLGRGAMGDVYQGRDLQTGRTVAIKALRPEGMTGASDTLARFLREGEALRTLNHPNIVQMVDALESDGRHYLVMEYVPGGSLRDLMERQGRLSIERTVEIALDVADALAHVHHVRRPMSASASVGGILHRDLKPSNVLLAEDGTPRLTDFGHARLATGPRLTQTGTTVGTVLYLSPEALRGETLDARADIWAFGVMLYEMLAGEVPFPGETFPEVFMAILGQPVPDLARIRPDVPDALADLVYRMLEKDRAVRIPSARLVGAELEAISAGSRLQVPARRVHKWSSPEESLGDVPKPPAEAPPHGVRVVHVRRVHVRRAADVRRPLHNLPVQPTPFVGREAELRELDGLLNDPNSRLVTILGEGGMGKTRLALRAAEMQVDRFAHGVHFVPLAPLYSPHAIVPAIAEALGFSFYNAGQGGAGTTPRRQLLDYLRAKEMLLLLDNFEHLVDGADLVADILSTAPGVRLLATSRVRLNVQGEYLFHLAGMDYPRVTPETRQVTAEVPQEMPENAADLEGRTEYSAVRLFVQSARRARPNFEPGAEDVWHISRICQLVGGMPLAIVLAAAWVEMLTPREIADELARALGSQDARETVRGSQTPDLGLDLLETELHDVPERQRSIRAVFDHSWNLLSAREQTAFQELSVFRGGFTREAAQQVTGISLRELMRLVDKSLLHRTPLGRYEIHELLRQYAAQRLCQSSHSAAAHDPEGAVAHQRRCLSVHGRDCVATHERHCAAVRDRHCAYYAGLLQEREAALIGREQGKALAEIEAEIDNVRAAWDWAVTQGRIKDIDRALGSLAEFYHIRAWFQEGEAAFARAAQRLAEEPSKVSEQPGAARPAALVLGKALTRQAWFCDSLGLVEKDSDLARKSLAILRELGAQREMAYALSHLGKHFAEQGKPQHQEALALFRKVDDRRGIAMALRDLGWAVIPEGEYAEARQLFQESLTLSRELGHQQGIAGALQGLGYVAWVLGEFETARRLHQESYVLRQGIGEQGAAANSLAALARDACGLQEYEKGKRLYEKSLAQHQEIGNLAGMAVVLGDLSELATVLGEYANATQLARESLALDEKLGRPKGKAWAFRVLGNAALGQGDLRVARGYLRQALEVEMSVRATARTLLTLVGIAAVLMREGQDERALEILALVLSHPSTWQWTADRAAPLVAELKATLPPDRFAAAQERGQARDLSDTVAELLTELEGAES